MKKTGLIGLILLAAACRGDAEPGAGPIDVASEIERASRTFSQAYVRGDTSAIRDLYTADAVLLPPGGEVRGRDAIVRFFAPGAERVTVDHAMESSEIRIAGDVAIDVGTWSGTWREGDSGTRTASERYLVVWERDRDGAWRMAYDMWHRP